MKNIYSVFLSLLMVISFVSCGSSTSSKVKNVDAKEFKNAIETQANAIVLDVRTPDEFNNGHIESAVNIDFNDKLFGSKVMELDRNKPLLIYCESGKRSSDAASTISANGFTNVVQLDGGISAWKKAGYEVSTGLDIEVLAGMTVAQFNQITSVSNKLVIVDFNAEWCKPCKLLEPILEEIEKENPGKVKLVKIDIDQNPLIAEKFAVSSIPLIYVFENGVKKWENMGLTDKPTILKGMGL